MSVTDVWWKPRLTLSSMASKVPVKSTSTSTQIKQSKAQWKKYLFKQELISHGLLTANTGTLTGSHHLGNNSLWEDRVLFLQLTFTLGEHTQGHIYLTWQLSLTLDVRHLKIVLQHKQNFFFFWEQYFFACVAVSSDAVNKWCSHLTVQTAVHSLFTGSFTADIFWQYQTLTLGKQRNVVPSRQNLTTNCLKKKIIQWEF